MPVLPPSTDRVDLILQFFCLLRGGSNLIHVKSDAAAAPARYNNAQPVIGYQHFTVMAPVQNGSLSPSSLSLSLSLCCSLILFIESARFLHLTSRFSFSFCPILDFNRNIYEARQASFSSLDEKCHTFSFFLFFSKLFPGSSNNKKSYVERELGNRYERYIVNKVQLKVVVWLA